jgi:hypothetical protein
MKFFAYLLAFIGVAVLPTLSYAAVLDDLVPGTQNQLEDDDFETLFNQVGSPTVVDVGDILFGIVRIGALTVPPGAAPPVSSYPQPSNTFTGVFAQKVLSKTVSFGGAADGFNDVFYTFTAPTLVEWAGLGFPAGSIATVAGTTLVLFDDPDDIDQSTGALGTSLASVGGTKLWEFGFPGGSPVAPLFTVAATDTDDITTAFTVASGSFTSNWDVTKYWSGPILIPQAVTGGTAQLLLRNGSIDDDGAVGSDFPIATDTDLLLTPATPEPASLLIWAGLASGLGIARLRRRKTA